MKLHEMKSLNFERPALGSFLKNETSSAVMPAQLPGKAAGLDSENDHRLFVRPIRRRPAGRLGGTLREVLAVTSSFFEKRPPRSGEPASKAPSS